MTIIANSTIRSNGRLYHAGQTVTGLSNTDIEWMQRGGYITVKESKKDKEKEKETANEL
jgi:hypothetical protein